MSCISVSGPDIVLFVQPVSLSVPNELLIAGNYPPEDALLSNPQEPLPSLRLPLCLDYSADIFLVEEFQGAEALMHRTTGLRSSAMTRSFEKSARRLYVSGLIGCTSVVIISEMGVWFSHHWEREQFLADDATFQKEVLGTIENGDPASLVAMPGAFSLADGHGVLNPKYNVQIFISTPKDRTTGSEIYETRVDKIVDLLTGARKPWAGIEPVRRGYLKPRLDTDDERNFEKRANSKVLIEYDNNQEASFGEEPKANQQAIYRVWLEQQVGHFHYLPECERLTLNSIHSHGNINGTPKLASKKMPPVQTPTRNGKMEVHAVSLWPAHQFLELLRQRARLVRVPSLRW